MKKILLAAAIILAGFTNINAQTSCTIDGTITEPGIYPDTLINLPPAFEGAAYGTTIQIRVLSDTTVTQGPVHVTNITVNTVVGMPSGFVYSCSPAGCIFPGGGNGCVWLSGNPAIGSAGTYSVVINSTLNGKLYNVLAVSQAFTTYGYKIVIHPKPTPSFSASQTTVCKGSTVTYTDASSDLASSWNWTFTGGTPSTSTLQNPVVAYNTAGTYNATLTVGNPAGTNTLTKTSYIVVKAPPAATIALTGNDTLCAGDTATLTANSGNGLTYSWYKNNVSIGATAKIYKTNLSGSYIVSVTNTAGCFKKSAAKKITAVTVTALVTANGPLTFCAGGSVTLSCTIGTGLTYQWYKGTNLLAGKTASSIVVTTGGTYKCVVTKFGMCSKTSNSKKVVVNCKLANEGMEASNEYSLFPNPATDFIAVNMNLAASQNLKMNVYDLTGRLVSVINDRSFGEGNNTVQVDVSALENGFYFIQIENGTSKQVLRFSVQHSN